MSHPNSVGDATSRPRRPPLKLVLLKSRASIANAAASVTTARFTPRSRRAGSPISRPSGTASSAATISENGNGMPLMWVSMNALKPANDICASETWPT